MSDEQQHQQHRQQQQQQQQQQQHAVAQLQAQHNNKIGKDNSNTGDSTAAMTATATANTAAPPRKSNIHEMRNQEFVSRLMAATPPYLYSAPVGPNNFFFSDMLRSLVQARNNETARNLQLQQAALARRPRKRAWSHPHPHPHPHRAYYEQHLRERKEAEERQQLDNNTTTTTQATNEKPLELTTNKSFYHLANKQRKLDDTVREINLKQQISSANTKATDLTESTTSLSKSDSINATPNSTPNTAGGGGGGGAVDAALQNNTPPAASLPPQDLVLPPPPPVWYPSLYPPYGIDPLHFFIDLRVSGHIYDRKKDNVSPLTSGAENVGSGTENDSSLAAAAAITLPNKHRHGSAFTVPIPRSNESKVVGLHNPNDVINLSSNSIANKFEHYAKYYDLGESKENQPFLKSNASANYMLQHLPRLYSQFAARDLIGQHMEQNNFNNKDNNTESSDNADNKSEEADCDADSNDGRTSNDAVDVEIIDSIKYRNTGGGNDEDSSRCSSRDDASITQID